MILMILQKNTKENQKSPEDIHQWGLVLFIVIIPKNYLKQEVRTKNNKFKKINYKLNRKTKLKSNAILK